MKKYSVFRQTVWSDGELVTETVHSGLSLKKAFACLSKRKKENGLEKDSCAGHGITTITTFHIGFDLNLIGRP